LAGKIKNIIGYTGEIDWDRSKPDGTYEKLLDNSRMKKIGWNAKVSFPLGLELVYNWYLKYGNKR
jgi:GDP-L-fucose synthase